jgi:hypothetical protein
MMSITIRPVGFGRAVVGNVGFVRGDENNKVSRMYSLAKAIRLRDQFWDFRSQHVTGQYALVSSHPFPDCHDEIHGTDRPDCLPSPLAPLRLVLDDPAEGDETTVKPVELEEDDRQKDNWGVDEQRINRVAQRRGIGQERDLDGDAGNVSCGYAL